MPESTTTEWLKKMNEAIREQKEKVELPKEFKELFPNLK